MATTLTSVIIARTAARSQYGRPDHMAAPLAQSPIKKGQQGHSTLPVHLSLLQALIQKPCRWTLAILQTHSALYRTLWTILRAQSNTPSEHVSSTSLPVPIAILRCRRSRRHPCPSQTLCSSCDQHHLARCPPTQYQSLSAYDPPTSSLADYTGSPTSCRTRPHQPGAPTLSLGCITPSSRTTTA